MSAQGFTGSNHCRVRLGTAVATSSNVGSGIRTRRETWRSCGLSRSKRNAFPDPLALPGKWRR